MHMQENADNMQTKVCKGGRDIRSAASTVCCLVSCVLCLLFSTNAFAQEDLLSLLEDPEAKKEDVSATFKTTRIVSGQSLELHHGGVLNFVIQHRFGPFNGGDSTFQNSAYNFFGLDVATIRLGLDMGITNRLNVGIGRNSFNKVYDGFVKYKITKQKIKGFPLTITGYSSMAINSTRWENPERKNFFSSRLYYTHQLLIGSRVTPSFSFQVVPTMVHRNLVDSSHRKNDVFGVGLGLRQKLTKRLSINAEYFYILPDQIHERYNNPLSIGFDIETGGHVFQLHFTNVQQMTDHAFLTETDRTWADGGVHFGFNISRVFTLYQWDKNF